MANKVKYNLKNVHYAKLTLASDGTATYGAVKPWPGAVSLSLEAQGEVTPFYADGIVYYQINNNNGYSGDFESALVPEDFKSDIMGETTDANGVMIENKNSKPAEFALMFEFDGDVNSRRHVLYRCTATRPAVSGQTTEESATPQTESVALSAVSLPNGLVKASTSDTTASGTYSGWFDAVYQSAGANATVRITGDDSVVKLSSITLEAIVTPSGTVVWSSNDTDIATVDDSTGEVTGVAAGRVVIMATLASDASVFDTKVITVTNS